MKRMNKRTLSLVLALVLVLALDFGKPPKELPGTSQEEALKTGSITIDGITDPNNDEKADVLDGMLAIEMLEQEENKRQE